MIIGSLTRLGFAIANHVVTEELVIGVAAAVFGGIGLMSARDLGVTSVDLGLQDVEKKTTADDVVTPTPTK